MRHCPHDPRLKQRRRDQSEPSAGRRLLEHVPKPGGQRVACPLRQQPLPLALNGGDAETSAPLQDQLDRAVALRLEMRGKQQAEDQQHGRRAARQRRGPRSALDQRNHAADQHRRDVNELAPGVAHRFGRAHERMTAVQASVSCAPRAAGSRNVKRRTPHWPEPFAGPITNPMQADRLMAHPQKDRPDFPARQMRSYARTVVCGSDFSATGAAVARSAFKHEADRPDRCCAPAATTSPKPSERDAAEWCDVSFRSRLNVATERGDSARS